MAEHGRTRKSAESEMCDWVWGKATVLEKTKQAGIAEAGKESREGWLRSIKPKKLRRRWVGNSRPLLPQHRAKGTL